MVASYFRWIIALIAVVIATCNAHASCFNNAYVNLGNEIKNSPDAPTNACIAPFLLPAPDWSSNDNAIADCLNVVRTGAANQLFNPAVPRRDLRNALNIGEVIQLPAGTLSVFNIFMMDDTVDFTSTSTQTQFRDMFPSATAPTTRANMIAIAKTQVARGQVICGFTSFINSTDVSRALRGQ